jgi:hypothetical protein
MTSITLTSGEIMDIISVLEEKENALYLAENHQLSAYYMNLGCQFQKLLGKLQELPGEHRVANLVLAVN